MHIISFLFSFSLFSPWFVLFYILYRISNFFPFHSLNDKPKKNQVILIMLQLHKATNILTGKLRARSWQKVHLLIDTEDNLTFLVLLHYFSEEKRGDPRVIKNTKMCLPYLIIILDITSYSHIIRRNLITMRDEKEKNALLSLWFIL